MNMIKKEAKHLVKFLEKWIELDVVYFFKGGAILFTTQFLLVLSSLILSIGFARLATKELFGQFQFILAILGALGVLLMPGTNAAVLLGISQNKEGTLLQGAWFKFKWSALLIIGLLLTAAFFYFKHEPRYAQMWPIFLIGIVLYPIVGIFDVVHTFFAGRREFSKSCAFQLITEAGSSLTALATLIFTKNLIYILLAYLLVKALGMAFAFRFSYRHLKNKTTDPNFASYSYHMSLINFIPYLQLYFDKLIVTYFLGFTTTAIYAIGIAIAEQLYAISKSVGLLVFPKIALQQKEKIYVEVKKRAGLLVLFFAFIAILVVLFIPIIIPFFFSSQYEPAIRIAQLLILVSIPKAVAFVFSLVQQAYKQQKKLYTINIIYASVEITSLIVLTPLYGLYGVVTAKALSNIAYLLTAWKSMR